MGIAGKNLSHSSTCCLIVVQMQKDVVCAGLGAPSQTTKSHRDLTNEAEGVKNLTVSHV